MSYIPGQPVTAVVQRVEIHKLRQGENLILGFSIGGGIDQDPSQNPFSEDKTDKGIYVTRVSEGGPAEIAGLQIGDKIMQVTGVPKEENKSFRPWARRSEALGGGGLSLPPSREGLTEVDLEPMLVLPPEDAGFLCVPLL
ncbi:tax1-binding protein 3 isoform X1 [Carlito syrichta]|uniref:Tax1-binding protein 3 n=1 Tax=Carlito syrichta TaxID=1868482 RepID=A0A3Q0E1N0_CARSF|nr:tax1-binding protein 3 isoform X1 [Carlito syrichta]